MVSCQMLAWIDARLKQIKENKLNFGGVHILVLGDFGQIPPIGQNALYSNLIKDDIGYLGKKLYKLFEDTIQLDYV